MKPQIPVPITDELKTHLDKSDETTCALEAVILGLLKKMGKGNSSRNELESCAHKLVVLRESHAESHNAIEQLCSLPSKLITVVMELEDKQFDFLHLQIRRLLVMAGCRDHVASFRAEVFADICEQHPEVMERYASLGLLTIALQQELYNYRAGRSSTRPLNDILCDSVRRLGLTIEQWRQLKALNSDSISAFHSEFSLEELKNEVFPAKLEPCRQVVIKAAETVQKRHAARTAAVVPNRTPNDANDFF